MVGLYVLDFLLHLCCPPASSSHYTLHFPIVACQAHGYATTRTCFMWRLLSHTIVRLEGRVTGKSRCVILQMLIERFKDLYSTLIFIPIATSVFATRRVIYVSEMNASYVLFQPRLAREVEEGLLALLF